MAEKKYKRTWYSIRNGKPHYEEVELTESEIEGLRQQRENRLRNAALAAKPKPEPEPDIEIDKPDENEDNGEGKPHGRRKKV